MMLPYDTVVFDLDGTLTKSEEGIMKSAAYALEKIGRPIKDFETLRAFIGPPLYYSFQYYIGLSEEESQRAVDYYRERYNTVGQYENAVYTGIRTLLYQLKKQGACVSIATGKPQEPTERILAHFKLNHFFDKIVGIQAHEHSASKKELIKEALPSKYKKAIMVGDRKFDIEGARENALDSIGVLYGYGSKEELEKAGATYLCYQVEEVSEILLGEKKNDEKIGFFLTMEGIDGSGKTTQVDYLRENLLTWGFDVVATREPGGNPIAEKIRNVVLDIQNIGMVAECEALLYAAARAQHVAQTIKPSIKEGKLVLCDRFVDSSIAYQGGGRRLGVKEVKEINDMAISSLMPDYTVYLVIDHEESLERRRKATALDRIEIEEKAFHSRVQKAYEEIIEKDKKRFILVDGTKEPEEVAKETFEKVLAKLVEREKN